MKQQDLLGQWTLTRKVFDRDRKPIAGMWGTGTYKCLGENELLYEECVTNRTGESSEFVARQSYLYLFKEKAIEVHRGKELQTIPFITLPYGEKLVDGYYTCKPDFYTLRWIWMRSHLFFTRFSVKGTRKDYTLETIFRR